MATQPPQYERQVLPRPAPLAQPGPSGAQALAEGVGALGDALVHHRALEIERDRRTQSAQAAVDLAQVSGDIDAVVAQRRETAAPDGAGHLDGTMEDARTRIDTYLSSIRDPRVRDAYTARAAEILARTRTSEQGFEIVRRSEHSALNLTNTVTLYSNQLPSDASIDQRFWQTVPTIRAAIAESGLSPAQQEQVAPQMLGEYAVAYINRRTEFDPQGTLEALHGGALNDLLPKGAMDRLTDSAQTEVRVREADQRRLLETARTAARTSHEMLQRRFNEHDPTLTEADFARDQQEMTAAGLAPQAHDGQMWQVQFGVDREFRTANSNEIRAEIGRLDERIAHGGANASPNDQVRRDRLDSLLPTRLAEEQHDPLASYQRAGGHVAPLNFADPASVRARVAAAEGAQRQTGFLQPLTQPEQALLREQAGSGTAGRMQALGALAALGAVSPDMARAAADQVAPGDRAFRYAVRSAPTVAQVIVNGGDARNSLAPVTNEDGAGSTVEAQARVWFNAHVAPALIHYPADLSEDLFQASLNVYAEKRRQAGVLNNRDFDTGGFDDSANFVLRNGARGGGTGEWNGAPFILPSGMDRNGFAQRMAFLPEGNQQWPRGSINGVPVWADGHTISRAELRSQFTPVPVRDGVYQWRRGNAVAMTAQGRPLEINFHLLTPPPHSAAGRASRMLTGRGDPESVRHPENARPVWFAAPGQR